LYNARLHYLYYSPDIDGVIRSRKMKCTDHVAHMEERRLRTTFLSDILKGRDHSEDLGVGGRTILEWILWKWDKKLTGFIWQAFVSTVMTLRIP